MTGRKLFVSINSSWNFVNFRSGLIKALVAAGYEVVAATADDGHRDRLEALGCRMIELPISGRGTSPIADGRLLLRYFRLIRRERPDVYLSYTVKPNIYGSLAAHRLGVPVINNIAGLGTAFLAGGWLNRIVRSLYRMTLRRSKIVFFQNPDDWAMFVRDRLVAPERARLLPGSGVDLAHFAAAPAPSGVPPRFLLVARLLWAKGVREYAEAARIVRLKHPHVRFQILGILDQSAGAVDRASLNRWEKEGNVEFLGSASDVRSTIAQAACVVLPSYYPEGTPRSLLEAAAMARPLITTDVPGCRQVIDDGVNGFLCAPRDAASLAAAMERFLALSGPECAAMGAASRAKAETEFDEQLVIRAYLEAIEEVLAQ